jgi:hypothetical protein
MGPLAHSIHWPRTTSFRGAIRLGASMRCPLFLVRLLWRTGAAAPKEPERDGRHSVAQAE